MELNLSPEQLWELLCTVDEGSYPLKSTHIYTLLDTIAPWHESFGIPWRGLQFVRDGMPRDDYYFMLFSFLYYAKLAGDI